MKSNIKWIVIFIMLCIICAVIWLWRNHSTGNFKKAEIIQNGQVIRTIDLFAVTEPYEIVVEDGNGGLNTVRVENGRIAVSDANCPDKVCVNQGFIENGVVPIVCLPHKLVVSITGENEEYDAAVGTP